MPYTQTMDRAFSAGIGPRGVPETLYAERLQQAEAALADLRAAHAARSLPLLNLPERSDDLGTIAETAAVLAGSSDVVFLGTGGSSLGGQALAQLADYSVPALGILREKPRVHFVDNLDPVTFERLLARLRLPTTSFVAISKSGSTGETLMQTIAVVAALERAGRKPADHVVGLTEARPNGLRALLQGHGCRLLDHDPNIGGRFSVLSNVGLLPAFVLGLDAKAIRAGAAAVVAPLLAKKPAAETPPACGAALAVAAAEAGKSITVLVAYADRLERFTRWWVQLWAESLGKRGRGTTPVAALGPVDQHSQLQLWLDGPADKVFTVITTGVSAAGPRMSPALAETVGEPAFAGRALGDLVAAQGRAVTDTLANNGRPVRAIHVARLDERSLGALFMHFMLETIIAAHLLGVDPFDQPAVEEGKILAKRYLGQ